MDTCVAVLYVLSQVLWTLSCTKDAAPKQGRPQKEGTQTDFSPTTGSFSSKQVVSLINGNRQIYAWP